jgi:hypothetical protein
MPVERWAIHLHKENFKFSCAHFLIFPDGSKERLHGHNYYVDAEIEGLLTDKGIVIDFIQVKPVIRELCDELDEHWVVPGQHPELIVTPRDDGHTEVHYRGCTTSRRARRSSCCRSAARREPGDLVRAGAGAAVQARFGRADPASARGLGTSGQWGLLLLGRGPSTAR